MTSWDDPTHDVLGDLQAAAAPAEDYAAGGLIPGPPVPVRFLPGERLWMRDGRVFEYRDGRLVLVPGALNPLTHLETT